MNILSIYGIICALFAIYFTIVYLKNREEFYNDMRVYYYDFLGLDLDVFVFNLFVIFCFIFAVVGISILWPIWLLLIIIFKIYNIKS